MRIVSVGSFLLPVRLDLGRLLAGGRDGVVAALRAEFGEFATPEQPAADGLLIDHHRSFGARQVETMLFEGAIDHPESGRLTLFVSSLSVGFVLAEFDLPDGTSVNFDTGDGVALLKTPESALTRVVAPLVADWSERVRRALRPEWTQPSPAGAMTSGVLWGWHRIAVDPPAGSDFAAPRDFGVTVTLLDGIRCSVANGFTNVYGPIGPLAAQVAEGIMVATQEWIVVDEAQRLLSGHLVRLSQTSGADLAAVESQYAELLALTEEVTLRRLILSEEQRYLANTLIRVKEAAMASWRLDDQVAELEERIAALRGHFALHRERITNNRDERRNRLIFVFTAVTVVQSVLLWYDFLTEPANIVAGQPRPTIALVVLALSVVALAGALISQVRLGVRVRASRRGPTPRPPHQRASSESAPDRSRGRA